MSATLPTVAVGALVLALALVPAVAGPAEPPSSLAGDITRALRRGGLRGARVGILVADLNSGEILYEKDADTQLVPASLTKIVTSAAALDALGPEYRFETVLYGNGRQQAGTWSGDLWLRARGDPSLVEERVWAAVRDLRERGIRRIEGSLHVDDSFFDRERYGEDWGAIGRSWYHAPHGAVSVNFNTREVKGRYVAITEDPGRHAGRLFAEMMEREGITLAGGVTGATAVVPEHAVPLVTSASKPMAEIVADLNKISNNFIAEQLLKTMGAERHGPPGTAGKGLDVVRDYLSRLGIDQRPIVLRDGSGLSHSNRLSARVLVQVLRAAVSDFRIGPEFLASLKIAGVEDRGVRFRDALCKRRMRVKTGHLSGVAALAGFAETAAGRRLAFAILANGYGHGRYAADRGIEDICEVFLRLDSGAPVANAPLLASDAAPAPASEPVGETLDLLAEAPEEKAEADEGD